MTARLPRPGSDDGQWGEILNDFLSQAHNVDGTLKQLDQSQIQDLIHDLAAKVNDAELSPVAKSGSYSDLADTPTIPTVAAAGTNGAALSATDPTTTDARTPTLHATTHAVGGSDPVSVSASQISATGTASSSTYLRGDGSWVNPAGNYPPVALPEGLWIQVFSDHNGVQPLDYGQEYCNPCLLPGTPGSILTGVGFGIGALSSDADALIRFGVRANNGGVPGNVLWETSVPASSAAGTTGWKTFSVNFTLPGFYWISMLAQSATAATAPTVRTSSVNGGPQTTAFLPGGLGSAMATPAWATGHNPVSSTATNTSLSLAAGPVPTGSPLNMQVPVFIAKR